MKSFTKLNVLGLSVSLASTIIFALHTKYIQQRSVGSRLAEMVVKAANVLPEKIDQKFIRKQIKSNRREYHIPNGMIIDGRSEFFYIRGMKIFKIIPDEEISDRRVLYLHGGGYINQPQPFHWWFLDRLVQETGMVFLVPIYPKAPEFSHEETYALIEALYEQQFDKTEGDLIIMGDSAGGGLSLGFTQMLRNEAKPLPKALILISPWLDVTLSHPAIPEYQRKDPMLGRKNLRKIGSMWAGNAAPDDYKVSPVYGSIDGLPSISTFVGTREICLPDVREFQSRLEDKKVPYNYYEYPMMNHNFPLSPIKEGMKARTRIAEILRQT